jgi:hypothetical protein
LSCETLRGVPGTGNVIPAPVGSWFGCCMVALALHVGLSPCLHGRTNVLLCLLTRGLFLQLCNPHCICHACMHAYHLRVSCLHICLHHPACMYHTPQPGFLARRLQWCMECAFRPLPYRRRCWGVPEGRFLATLWWFAFGPTCQAIKLRVAPSRGP